MVAKSLLLPGDHRAWLDKREGSSPARPQAGQPRPEEAIGRAESRAVDGLLIDRDLMLKREDL
jgi:hypothetical protein